MTVALGVTFFWGVAGSILILTIRAMARPTATPTLAPTPRRDWSDKSFGVDLIVTALIGAPVVLATRLSIAERLENIRDHALTNSDLKDLIDHFFVVRSNTIATYHVLGIMTAAILSVCGYVWLIKRHGYDARVPRGCHHPALRLRGFVMETSIGVGVAIGTIVVAARVTG